jgi:hypothetical protein
MRIFRRVTQALRFGKARRPAPCAVIGVERRHRPKGLAHLVSAAFSRGLVSCDVGDHLIDIRVVGTAFEVIERLLPAARPGFTAIEEGAIVDRLPDGLLQYPAVCARAALVKITPDRGSDLGADMTFITDHSEIAAVARPVPDSANLAAFSLCDALIGIVGVREITSPWFSVCGRLLLICRSRCRGGAFALQPSFASDLLWRRHVQCHGFPEPPHPAEPATSKRINKTIEKLGVVDVMRLHRVVEGRVDNLALLLGVPPMCPIAEWTCPALVERDWLNRRPFFRIEPGL